MRTQEVHTPKRTREAGRSDTEPRSPGALFTRSSGRSATGLQSHARSCRCHPVAAIVVLALSTLGCDGRPRARIETAGGEVLLDVAVQVARDEDARRRGLRGRTSLAPDEGLWIAFPAEDEICLVNDGVPFAIDAILLRERVVSEVLSLEADDPTPRCARASEVLEVAAGVARDVYPGLLAILDE